MGFYFSFAASGENTFYFQRFPGAGEAGGSCLRPFHLDQAHPADGKNFEVSKIYNLTITSKSQDLGASKFAR